MARCNIVGLLIGLSLVMGTVAPQSSRADGDPASDYLVTVDIFVPSSPPPVQALHADLDNLVFAAKRQGYFMKVALIGSRADLGAVPQLFGHPQTYAKFLASELRFAYNGRLLIVMPQGFGTAHVPKREASALGGLKIAAANSDDLVRTGMAAVRASAAAAGLKLPVLRPTATTPPTNGAAPPREAAAATSLPVVPVAAGLVGLILIAGAGLFAWRRLRARP
jgi:hypothetical protein